MSNIFKSIKVKQIFSKYIFLLRKIPLPCILDNISDNWTIDSKHIKVLDVTILMIRTYMSKLPCQPSNYVSPA